MTDFQEFTFLSSDGRTQLHGAQWTPADREPIAVLQIAHGVAEHILRYDDFARYLNDRGILVAGHDHLGHGKSLPEHAGVFRRQSHLGDGGGRHPPAP